MRPARSTRAAALCLVLLAGGATATRAQGAPPTAPKPSSPETPAAPLPVPTVRPGGVLTRTGQELVLPSQVIAVVEITTLTQAGIGAVLARCKVIEGLHAARGHKALPGDELTLLTYPGHMVEGSRELMFLRRLGRGERYELIFRVPEHEEHYVSKLAVARQTMLLSRIADARARADATVDWMVQALEFNPGGHLAPAQQPLAVWWARYALDELGWMLREQPWVFRPGDALRLERAGERWADSELGPRVESVSSQVRDAARRLYAPPEKATSSR